jgi:hypothetical protein
MPYMIDTTDGTEIRGAFRSVEGAAEALRLARGWEAVVLSAPFADQDGEGRVRSCRCAYETAYECAADEEGASADRIVEIA